MWEYMSKHGSRGYITQQINMFANQGWELVTVISVGYLAEEEEDGYTAFIKRKKGGNDVSAYGGYGYVNRDGMR